MALIALNLLVSSTSAYLTTEEVTTVPGGFRTAVRLTLPDKDNYFILTTGEGPTKGISYDNARRKAYAEYEKMFRPEVVAEQRKSNVAIFAEKAKAKGVDFIFTQTNTPDGYLVTVTLLRRQAKPIQTHVLAPDLLDALEQAYLNAANAI